MLCDAAFELISAHLDGTNTPAEEAALQAHLSECPACQALLETMTALELNTKNQYEFEVVNTQFSTLPSTGGIGTKLFYLFGGMLAIGSGVLLVTKKRVGKEEQ